jgi:hypothetical protein
MLSERSKKPALSMAEGNLVPQARNEMLRFAQHDRLDPQDCTHMEECDAI